jgi:hypothetical protein
MTGGNPIAELPAGSQLFWITDVTGKTTQAVG